MRGRPVDNALLTTEQAAARLGLGKHTLEVWRMKADLPPIARTLGLARHAFLGLFGREIPES
jgi:hypothetical protein